MDDPHGAFSHGFFLDYYFRTGDSVRAFHLHAILGDRRRRTIAENTYSCYNTTAHVRAREVAC